MGRVTNLILHIGPWDIDKNFDNINRYFETRKERGLVSLDDPALPRGWYGGTKMFMDGVYVGAFNYLDLEHFRAYLKTIDWEDPEDVQLIVCDEEDERFRIVTLTDPPAAE